MNRTRTRERTVPAAVTTIPLGGARCSGPAISIALAALAMAGCGGPVSGPTTPAVTAGTATFTGRVHGGQQPIVGAFVHLYAAGGPTYGGSIGEFGTALTDATGSFNMTTALNCQANLLVYMVAIGGNPGVGTSNTNIAEMATLGFCDTLNSSTYVQINELTTVASVYALSAFMYGPVNVGSSTTNLQGLQMAFGDVNELVNTATGTIPGPALPTGATLPMAKMNSLADIIAACVNSAGGEAGDGSICGTLFTAATPPGGQAPTDTVTALVNIAHYPANNVASLFGLIAADQVYTPTLAHVPNDWMLAATYAPAGISGPASLAVDTYGNVWIANKAGNSVTELSHSGAALAGSSYPGPFSTPSALALDASGNAWVAQSGNQTVLYLTPNSGSAGPSGTGGLNLPSSVAIDAAGNVWVANNGANTVTELNSSGASISGSGYSGTGIVKPLGVAISNH
jgi:hypothetical protein